ncbi:MAG TPA: hypothetical protein EYH30_05215, partial [Anaerolineales bacterium]|nr:hypothetical protein [Anaerolineales bacterium]
MTTGEHQDNYSRNWRRRDLLMFFLILLVGIACLLLAAQIAATPARVWEVPAGMLSELNPDDRQAPQGLFIEPLRPEIMTLPPWGPDQLLTPQGPGVVVPPAVFVPAGTDTPAPTTAVAATPSSTPTP